MQEQEQFGGRSAGGMGREQPVELVGLCPDLVAMQRDNKTDPKVAWNLSYARKLLAQEQAR